MLITQGGSSTWELRLCHVEILQETLKQMYLFNDGI